MSIRLFPAVATLVLTLPVGPLNAKDFFGDRLPDGTSFPLADNITGTNGDDNIYGLKLGDTLNGAGGKDTILGGPGTDEISGGTEDDTLHGDADKDTIFGDDGNDDIFGDGGDDELNGGEGADDIEGGIGNDTIRGGSGGDLLEGEAGTDTISGGPDGDQIFGGSERDILSGGPGIDELIGGPGNDDLYGGQDRDTLRGGDDNDFLKGEGNGGFVDFYMPGNGIDIAQGSDDVDIFDLDTDVTRSTGRNEITAFGGNDHINGGIKPDIVSAGRGTDYINDPAEGPGDRWSGGPGSDWLRYQAADHPLTFDLSFNHFYGPDNDRIFGIENFVLSPFSDTMIIDYRAADTVNTDARGRTYLLRILGALAIDNKAGDVITVLGNKQALGLVAPKYGAIVSTFDGPDRITTGGLSDGISTFDGPDIIKSGAGDDEINSGKGADDVEAGPGDDKVYAEEGADIVFGGIGSDGINAGQILNLTTFSFDYDKDPDILIYTSVAESPAGSGKFDVIDAFDTTRDKVDLSRIDANSVAVGNQNFRIVNQLTGNPGEVTAEFATLPQPHIAVRAETNGKPGDDLYIALLPPTLGHLPVTFIKAKIIVP